MARKKVEEIVAELAGPILKDNRCELVDVEFVKEGGGWYLRIYIDKPGGVTIDDCQVVSERVSVLLDETDPIPQSYYLEVSSPGIGRPLKKDSDFERYRGEHVEVKLYEPMRGEKIFEGELEGLENGNIVIRAGKNEVLKFERSKVAHVKRVVKL